MSEDHQVSISVPVAHRQVFRRRSRQSELCLVSEPACSTTTGRYNMKTNKFMQSFVSFACALAILALPIYAEAWTLLIAYVR